MIKKILTLLLIISMGLLLSVNTSEVKEASFNSSNTVNMSSILDEKIAIQIKRDANIITINHSTNYTFTHAVVEYAYFEDGIKISRLGTFEINDSKVTLARNINILAVKVHQVKRLVGNVYYTNSTTGTIQAGSFDNVVRKNIVRIETKAHNRFVYLPGTNVGQSSFLDEFYFTIDAEYDYVESVDVNFKTKKPYWFTYKITEHNKHVHKDDTLYVKQTDRTINLLEKNTSELAGDYVVRLNPGDYNSTGTVENFAIIKIELVVDGEFILNDVLNDPSTPLDDDIKSLEEVLKKITDVIDRIIFFFNNISDFFASNSPTFLKIGAVILAIIIYAIFSPIVKIIWRIIKLIFNTIIKILAGLFGWLF